MPSLSWALQAAADLASEDGENPEYDRALCELIVDTFGSDLRDLDPHIMDDGMETARPWVADRIRSIKGGFAMAISVDVEEVTYEKCRDCHLFVEPNDAYTEGSNIAPFVHLARDNVADQRLDENHEPFPSGMKANLNTWRVLGPVAMRERFVTPKEWANA